MTVNSVGKGRYRRSFVMVMVGGGLVAEGGGRSMMLGRERETRRPMRRLLVIDRFLRIDSTCEPFVLRSRGGMRILRANSNRARRSHPGVLAASFSLVHRDGTADSRVESVGAKMGLLRLYLIPP